MNLSELLFAVIALSTSFSALGVVFSPNIVRAAVWLLFTLIGVSMIYFYLGAEFLGASQLIVYVGGTLVLVVFGVMLTAQGPALRLTTKTQEIVTASVICVLFFAMLVTMSIQFGTGKTAPSLPSEKMGIEVGTLGLTFMNLTEVSPDVPLSGFAKPESAPRRTANAYLLPFEILSVHLLVVLIGAAYLARAKRRSSPAPVKKEAS